MRDFAEEDAVVQQLVDRMFIELNVVPPVPPSERTLLPLRMLRDEFCRSIATSFRLPEVPYGENV